MRPVWLVALAACGGAAVTQPPPAEPEGPRATLAEDESYRPSYAPADVQRALISERAAEATGERKVAELEAHAGDAPEVAGARRAGLAPLGRAAPAATDDALRSAQADLAVRRRFIATLEACQAAGRLCPPRLDELAWAYDPDPEHPADPPMSAVLRFDLESWRALAHELHGRACACRTQACVDSVATAIEVLERRPMAHVQGDDTASASITWARECLARLRGRAAIPTAAAPAE